jgi:hypothetical protein
MKSCLSEGVGLWLGALVVLLTLNPAGRADDEEELRGAWSKAWALYEQKRFAEAQ